MLVVRRVRAARSVRGFSMLEALVAFVLFLTAAAMLTWAITSAFSTRATAVARAQVADVVSAQLDAMTSYSLDALSEGTFTVPSPCPGTPAGIDGVSCVPVGSSTVRVAYRFPDPSAADVALCPGESADPGQVLASQGRLLVQACATGVANAAFKDAEVTGVPAGVPAQTRTLTADSPSQTGVAGGQATAVGGRRVVVHLSGAVGDLGAAPVVLVAGDPLAKVAQGPVVDGVATVVVEAGVCSVSEPCSLEATATATGRTLTLTDRAGAGAAIVTPDAGGTVHVYAQVSR